MADGASENYREGLRLLDAGDVAAAEVAFRRGDLAGDRDCANEYGVCRARRGDLGAAESAFRRAADAGSAVAWSNLSLVLLDARNDAPGAIAALERAQELGYPPASFNLGCLLRERGDLAGADRAWARGADAGDGEAAFNLGLLRSTGGDAAGAQEAWRRGHSLGNLRSTESLGRALQEAGDVEGALALYREGDGRGDAESAFSLGALLYERGDVAEAVAAFERSGERGKEGLEPLLAKIRSEHPELGGGAALPESVTVGDLLEVHRAEQPRPASVQATPLPPGEERLVQVVHRPDGNRNDIYVAHSGPEHGEVMGTGEPVRFVALIRGTDDTDGEPFVWYRASSLERLYVDIAMASRNQPPLPGCAVWHAPEIEQLIAGL